MSHQDLAVSTLSKDVTYIAPRFGGVDVLQRVTYVAPGFHDVDFLQKVMHVAPGCGCVDFLQRVTYVAPRFDLAIFTSPASPASSTVPASPDRSTRNHELMSTMQALSISTCKPWDRGRKAFCITHNAIRTGWGGFGWISGGFGRVDLSGFGRTRGTKQQMCHATICCISFGQSR
eukprot:12424784-Karenia_brevis.AAC.1